MQPNFQQRSTTITEANPRESSTIFDRANDVPVQTMQSVGQNGTQDTLQQNPESLRIVQNPGTEPWINHPNRKSEKHTLTVREVARMFESANVARSERSITNWCQPNRQGIARLDAYFDPNERRYFITPDSVDAVIAEEKAKSGRNIPGIQDPVLPVEEKPPTPFRNSEPHAPAGGTSEWADLARENRDLQITNRVKDQVIENLQQDRDKILKQLIESSRENGVLETKMSQLGSGENFGLLK